MKKIIRAVISLLISLLIFSSMLIYSGENIASILFDISIICYAIAIICDNIVITLLSFRWRYILKEYSTDIGILDTFKTIYISVALNNLLPSGRILGDLARPYLLRRKLNKSTMEILATVFVDKIYDLSLAFLFGGIFLLNFFLKGKISYIFPVISLIIFAAILMAYIYTEKILNKIVPYISSKYHTNIDEFSSRVSEMMKNSILNINLIIITLISIIFLALRVKLIFMALNLEISLFICLQIVIIETVLSGIPITPGGLGIVEGGILFTFTLLDIPKNIAIVFTVLNRFVSYWLRSSIGLSLLIFTVSDYKNILSGKF